MRLILIDDETEIVVGQIEDVEQFDLTSKTDRNLLLDEIERLIEPYK